MFHYYYFGILLVIKNWFGIPIYRPVNINSKL